MQLFFIILLIIFLIIAFAAGAQSSVSYSQLFKKLKKEQPVFLGSIAKIDGLFLSFRMRLYWLILFGYYRNIPNDRYQALFDRQKWISRLSLIAIFLAIVSLIIYGILRSKGIG